MRDPAEIPVLAFAGFSGSGKTTLIEKLIPLLRERGISAAVIKHDAHGLTFDTAGKDSSRFSEAGAAASLVNGPDRTALFLSRALTLEGSVALLQHCGADLILIEGYKRCSYPQIGLSRRANGKGFPAEPSHFIALATDEPMEDSPVPAFALDDAEGIAGFIADYFLSDSIFKEKNTMKLSARNQFKGTVTNIAEGAVNGIVTIDVAGEKFSATISMSAIRELGLAVGKEAYAVIKATEVMVGRGKFALSARNQFAGKVVDIQKGAVNSIVKIEIAGRNVISATISCNAVEELALKPGEEATAVIKATSVMVGVDD